MFGKKKKGDLGNVVFPEFPPLKSADKKLPPLNVPDFSKFKESKTDKPVLKDKKLELPDLKLPSFSSLNKSDEIKKVKEAVKAAPPVPVIKQEKYAPPSHFIKQSKKEHAPVLKIKAPEVKQAAQPVFKPAAPVVKKSAAKVRHHRAKIPFKIINPLEFRLTKVEKPVAEVKHMKKAVAKPKITIKKHIHRLIKIVRPKIARERKVEKKLPKHKAIHLKPIKMLHPIRIHNVKIHKEKHHKPKKIFRALKHVTVKGPVKPRDKITIKTLGHHMSDLAKDLSELKSETIKEKPFKGLGKTVDKEAHSIKRLYGEFNKIQKKFRDIEESFQKARFALHHQIVESKNDVRQHYEEKKRVLDNELDAARKSVHKELLAYKSSLMKDWQAARKLMNEKQDSMIKSMTEKQDSMVKSMTNKQDNLVKSVNAKQEELVKKINNRLNELASNNEALTKDLGKITLIESRFNEKLDVNVYNQLVRKINELEANTADNENKLDSDLRATMQYVKELGEAFQNSVKVREAIKERILQHEQIIKQLQYMIRNKPKFDLNKYLQEYNKEQQQQFTEYQEGSEVAEPQEEAVEEAESAGNP